MIGLWSNAKDQFNGLIRTTAQKMKFSIKDFFSKCDQIHRKLRIWSHLLKKSLMENFIFCAVHYRHVVQYNRFNQTQFTPNDICKSCGNLCERQKCDAKKLFEFPEEKSMHVVTIKHFGTHLCFPIKPKGKRDIKEIIAFNPNKVSKAKRDILYTIICEGANFEDIEDKASQLMDHIILNKIKASDNQPEFAQVINVRERYKKTTIFRFIV